MPELTAEQVLEIERSIIDDGRKNDEAILRVREMRDTTRSRYISLALAVGAIVIPVMSAVDAQLDRRGLRQVAVLLAVAVVVALVGSVVENIASTRRAKLVRPRDVAALKQLVMWRRLGTPLPPAAESEVRRTIDAKYQRALEIEAWVYRVADVITVGLITTAMLRLTGVFLWSGF